MKSRRKHYREGIYAEYIAAIYLWFKGYRILSRRFKTPMGEIDVIARRGNDIIFAEVKWRPMLDRAAESVTEKSRKRIEQAGYIYMSKIKERGINYRFDIIAISPPFFIRHMDNAWRPLT